MKKHKNAESLLWIIIWVFILSIALVWIINIINFNKDILLRYNEDINKYLLSSNAQYILKKIDTSKIAFDQHFYVYKDKDNKDFQVFTWTINEEYSYINKFWEKVDPAVNIWKTYKRVFYKNNDVLRDIINPNDIQNMVIHFDANNIDWTNNSTINDWNPVTNWSNLANNWDAIENTSNQNPKYKENSINWLWWVQFDWVDDLLIVNNNELLNNDDDNYSQFSYDKKSFALTFKTWDNVNSDQVIYEQWWAATWYNFVIHDWNLYAWIHNKADNSYPNTDFSSSDSTFHFEWDSWHQLKSVNLWEILPDTIYFIMIVQDSTHMWETGDENIDDSMNKLQIYLNWILVNEIDHVDPQPEHWKIWLWNINEWSIEPWSGNTISQFANMPFEWYIWEFISWNHALGFNEVLWIQNYFMQKWLWKYSNVVYDNIETSITKYNKY